MVDGDECQSDPDLIAAGIIYAVGLRVWEGRIVRRIVATVEHNVEAVDSHDEPVPFRLRIANLSSEPIFDCWCKADLHPTVPISGFRNVPQYLLTGSAVAADATEYSEWAERDEAGDELQRVVFTYRTVRGTQYIRVVFHQDVAPREASWIDRLRGEKWRQFSPRPG